jgi:GH15 family glucan-1,4-alpha-glucosidase
LRRSALAAALHADSEEGAVASGLDRGLSAYCWPRDALWVSGALERLGHPSIARGVLQWLNRVRITHHPFLYWFQKYSMDGAPEWETPAIDQTAMIPWRLEQHYRRTGDLDLVTSVWPMVEQAAQVCQGDSGGHPGLYLDESLKLIYSAGMGDQIFGAFLYSNACVVAGLRAAARLALLVGRSDTSKRWNSFADSIWEEGILREPAREPADSPGLIDPETGRFLSGRRISTLRDLWTRHPDYIMDRSDKLDVSMLGLAVPLGLLPSSDPRLVKTAQTIIRANNKVSNDTDVLARFTYEANPIGRTALASAQQEVSSLGTLWMVRYLIQLGRETGQGRHWNRAITMIEAILSRMSPLGLVLRPTGRGPESARVVANPGGNAWRLHALLIDTMLDLGGLEYDAVDRRLTLQPVLPGPWPQTGITRKFACGSVTYRLERPLGANVHRLRVETDLNMPVALQIQITCPGLSDLGPWNATPTTPAPFFDSSTGRLSWSVRLPFGTSERSWTWG